MSKYYNMDDLPVGSVECILQERSLPAYKFIFRDGYEEMIIQFPGDPPIGFSKRFSELVASHGHPVDYRSMKIVNNEATRNELNRRYGIKMEGAEK